MFRNVSTTLNLIDSSIGVLRRDKRLMLFPLISWIFLLMTIGCFSPVYPRAMALAKMMDETHAKNPPVTDQIEFGILLFLFYIAVNFITTFFNTALATSIISDIKGKKSGFGDALGMAMQKWRVILGWSVFSATVGMILQGIERRGWVGEIVGRFLDIAFALASFFVVPIFAIENKGPIDALKESAGLFKKSWGKQVAAAFSFGTIWCLLLLPAMIAGMALSIFFHSELDIASIAVLGVGYFILTNLFISVLEMTFRVALYLYTADGIVMEGFDAAKLKAAFAPK